jgi:hypothetical protein
LGNDLAWALDHARRQTLSLAAEIAPEQMTRQSVAGERHPAWILGHLLLSDTYLLFLLKARDLSADFSQLLKKYGPEAPPASQPERYDPRDKLVARLNETNAIRIERVGGMTAEELSRPTPDPVLARTQPSIGQHIQSLVFHEGYHAGQLSAWRKARGLTPTSWTFARKME